MEFTKSLYKREVAEMLGWSESTLRRYLNKKYLSRLEAIGYTQNQKKLTPKQLNLLDEILDLSPG